MTLATDTLWFEAAVMAMVIALGHILLGHFEEQTPKWRKVGKLLGSICVASLFAYRALRCLAAECWPLGRSHHIS